MCTSPKGIVRTRGEKEIKENIAFVSVIRSSGDGL